MKIHFGIGIDENEELLEIESFDSPIEFRKAYFIAVFQHFFSLEAVQKRREKARLEANKRRIVREMSIC